MDKKTVSHSLYKLPLPETSDAVVRALRIIISKGGTFRTEERWVYTCLQPLVDNGHIKVSGTTISLGKDIENYLLEASKAYPQFIDVFKEYREWMFMQREIISNKDSSIVHNLEHFSSTDQQIIYLANMIAELSGAIDSLSEIVSNCVSTVNDTSLSLGILESVVYGENTNK